MPYHADPRAEDSDSARARAAQSAFQPGRLGWFKGTFWPQIGAVAIIIAFGHSLLSMSGFETLAQVYREIAYPKLKNLRYTGNLVCIYAVICTGVITALRGHDHSGRHAGQVCG